MIEDPTRLNPPENVDSSLVDQVKAVSVEQAIQSMQLMKAKNEAEASEYQKRLVMQQFRPCKIYPVMIYHDGIRWVCSYGVLSDQYRDYLPHNALGQTGVEAYGECPEDAMKNFDSMWVGADLIDDDEEEEGEEDE